MATLTAKIVADFTTVLASELSVGGTTATLSSATDDDGVALPAGRYFFTIDGSNSSKEHISCDLSSTALTNIKTVSRQGVETAGTLRKHRIGASVSITDFAHILQINNLINGTTDLNSADPLKYDGTATITDNAHLATKKYVDDTAIAGAPIATETVQGIAKLSVAATSAIDPVVVGTNDGRVPTQGENDALVGNNTDVAVGTGNKMVTQTGLQHNAEKYAADAGANDTYVITLSPAPTSYTAGMVVHFKANTANTGTATLNVNGLGAKTIVRGVSSTLENGDIPALSLNTVIYDGTNFVLQNPTTTPKSVTYASISGAAITTTQNIDTVITTPFTPKTITVYFALNGLIGAGSNALTGGIATFDGTTIKSVYYFYNNSSTGNFGISVGDTSPTAGGDASNGGWTMSIQSLSATGFTLRLTYTQGSTFNGGAYKATVTATA